MLKHCLCLGAAFCLVVACQSTQLDVPPDRVVRSEAAVVVSDREIVVVSNSKSDVDQFLQKALQLGYGLQRQDSLDLLELQMLVMILPEGRDGAAAIRELESLAPSITAGVNHAYLTYGSAQENTARVYAPSLLDWSPSACAAVMPIGVLDTAIDPRRFGDALVRSADFSRQSRAEETSEHATMIADLVIGLSLLSGPRVYHADIVSPDASLGDVASVDSMLRGLNWLMEQDVRLINVSLAGPYNKILDRAFQRAEQEGIIIVAAAGNAGPSAPTRYPAGFDSTIAVTAVDLDTKVYARAVQGPQIDFSAPGVDVFVSSNTGGRYVSGTSVAAPFVTLRIAGDPDMPLLRNVGEVRKALASDAKDLGDKGHDPIFGWGLIRSPKPCRK